MIYIYILTVTLLLAHTLCVCVCVDKGLVVSELFLNTVFREEVGVFPVFRVNPEKSFDFIKKNIFVLKE